jgi:hypothetical protein
MPNAISNTNGKSNTIKHPNSDTKRYSNCNTNRN